MAVLEKGYLGGGNTGRNTTIIRSNYMAPGNTLFYEKSMQLWEGLSQDLNFNVMFSQRGQLNLGHCDGQMAALARRGNTMRVNGIDPELLGAAEVQQIAPRLDFSRSMARCGRAGPGSRGTTQSPGATRARPTATAE